MEMEGGQERKDREEGGEAQGQEGANDCRNHTEAKGVRSSDGRATGRWCEPQHLRWLHRARWSALGSDHSRN